MKNALHKTLKLYKDAYSGHPKEIWALGAFTLINRLGTMVVPFLTVYLTTIKGFSLKEAGILLTAFGLGSIIGTFTGGKLSDKFGPNPVMSFSLLLSGIVLFCLQYADSFWVFFAMILMVSLFGDAYRPALSAAVGMYVPKSETGRSMSFIRIAINLGFSGASAIGGYIAATLGYTSLFWIDGITCILAAIYLALVSSRWTKTEKQIQEEAKEVKQEKGVPPYKNRLFLLFILASFFMGLGFIQWFHTIPVFIKTEWGFDERYIGMMMTFNGLLIVFLEMPVIHLIEKRNYIEIAFLLGLVLLGLSFLPFFLPAALISFGLAMLLFTFGEMLFLPFNNSIALNISPSAQRGEYMSWYWMSWSLCHILGPALGLSFIDEFGYDAFWGFIIGIMLLSLWITKSISKEIIEN